MNRDSNMVLAGLLHKTAQASRRSYARYPRAVSLNRLNALLKPNLDNPIFIVGSPRSGTTFLGNGLAQLPEVSYHFEPVATKFAARWVYEQRWSFSRAQSFYRGVYGWLMRLHGDADLRFAEKTPRNCFLIPFLHKAFPEAVFIHITRDGRDVALSYSKKPWLQQANAGSGKREPGGYAHGTDPRFWVEPDRLVEFETTSDIHRCIWAWRRHVESALTALATVAPHQQHTVQYESLVQNPRGEADNLLDFLGIEAPTSRDAFHQHIAGVRGDSVGAWKRELSCDALAQIEREASDLLHAFYYA